MNEFNILISSAGRRVELMQAFHEALRDLGIRGAVYATDCSGEAPAMRLAERAWRVPRCHEPCFAPELLELAARENISMIVPTIDAELEPLSVCRQSFLERDTFVSVSAPETVMISVDKALTHTWLVANGFPTVAQSTPDDVLRAPAEWTFPLIVKPRFGSASKGVHYVRSVDELRLWHESEPGLIVQSVAEGSEYTVNVYVNAEGKCVCAVPHRRIEVRAGEVSKAVTVKNRRLMQLARDIAETLPGARGALNIQCFLSADGAINVIEINARFGGGYPLAHRAGAPFTNWLVEELVGRPVTGKFDEWLDDLVMLRYDQAVFQPGYEIRAAEQISTVVSGIGSGRHPLSGERVCTKRV
jgi:carbamoyl-phosphate synthase large subunit